MSLKIRSSFPFFNDQDIKSILTDTEKVLRQGYLSNGTYTRELEKKFCDYSNSKYAVAVSSGHASLEIALRYFNIKNKEVIVPTNTFVATPNSVVLAGGRPVFADIQEDTLCIDIKDVKQKINPKTKGVILVHIAGLICPQIQELKEICADNNLFLLEDCAHAHGATINNKAAGTIGDAGGFSFAPTKNISTGEGGILTTNNKSLAETAISLRNRGLDSNRLMINLGSSWLLSEISAILGIHQLENLRSAVQRRNEIAKLYEKQLDDIEEISTIKTPSNTLHAYHKFPLKINKNLNVEKIVTELKEKYSIETSRVYYPPCHLHPYYKKTYKTHEGQHPVAERVLKQTLTLPIHMALDNEQIEYVSNAVKSCINTTN